MLLLPPTRNYNVSDCHYQHYLKLNTYKGMLSFTNILFAITNFIGVASILVLIIYVYLKKCYRYWEARKVPYVKPKSLIFGSNFELITRRTSFQEYHADLYNQLAPHRFGGYYTFQRPYILIRDPDIIRHVLSTDFQKFRIRHSDATRSEPLRLHIFNLHGDEWKAMKEKLSPTFSPAKIRIMVDLMKKCAQEIVHVLKEPAQDNADVFISDIVDRYGTDVISTCAFGFCAHALSNPDAEFHKMTKRMIEPHFRFKLRSLLMSFSPKLCSIIKPTMFQEDAVNYFLNLVDEAMKYREKNNVVRNDFIDLLIAIKSEELEANGKDETRQRRIDVSLESLAAQCFAFFFAANATQSLISSALLELARNPHIQDKLRHEIDKVFDANGQLDYDTINQMKYMDQVISENIRCYPGQPVLFRQCAEDYKIPGTEIVIEKGVNVLIPRYGINHDPKYYPNPDVFDPEHFSDEAKANRHPYAHLLFGDGPRRCMGMRFGQMHIKVSVATLLRHYKFTVSPKMKFPLRYTSDIISTNIAGGIWLRCTERN